MTIQVWKINDYEWWAGEGTPEEILAAYMDGTGCSRAEAIGEPDDEEMPEALTDEEMLRYKMTDVDENEQPTGRHPTFREYLDELIADKTEFPCVFASTDW